MYKGLNEVIEKYKPETVAIEEPFINPRNLRSALAVGQAQAVAILAAVNRGLPVQEYPPATVKMRVAAYGASSKEQIQLMVKLQLGMAELTEPDDAADALAVAICHVNESAAQHLLERQTGRRI